MQGGICLASEVGVQEVPTCRPPRRVGRTGRVPQGAGGHILRMQLITPRAFCCLVPARASGSAPVGFAPRALVRTKLQMHPTMEGIQI